MNTYINSTKILIVLVLASLSWIVVALDPSLLRGATTTTDDDRRLVGCRAECAEHDAGEKAACMAICRASGKLGSKTQAELLATTNSTCDSFLSQTSKNPTVLTRIVQESLNSPYIFEYDGTNDSSYIVDGSSDMFNGGNAITASSLANFEDPCSSGYMFGSGHQHSENSVSTFSSSNKNTSSSADTCCSGYWFFNRIPYTKGEVVQHVFGTGSSYYTVEADGVFVLSVSDASIDWVKVNGMTGRDDFENNDEDVKSYEFEVVAGGLTHTIIVKSVAASSSVEAPTIIHVWIIPSEFSCRDSSSELPSHVYSFRPYCDDDMISNPGSKFDYLLVSMVTGHPTQETIQNLVEGYVGAGMP